MIKNNLTDDYLILPIKSLQQRSSFRVWLEPCINFDCLRHTAQYQGGIIVFPVRVGFLWILTKIMTNFELIATKLTCFSYVFSVKKIPWEKKLLLYLGVSWSIIIAPCLKSSCLIKRFEIVYLNYFGIQLKFYIKAQSLLDYDKVIFLNLSFLSMLS